MAIELLSNGAINTKALISGLYPIEDLSEAILKTAGRDQSLKNVIVFP